jgi:hypothetical protein
MAHASVHDAPEQCANSEFWMRKFLKIICKQCHELTFWVGTLAALEYVNAFSPERTPHGSSTAVYQDARHWQ